MKLIRKRERVKYSAKGIKGIGDSVDIGLVELTEHLTVQKLYERLIKMSRLPV